MDKLLGLCGYAGAGKDFIEQRLHGLFDGGTRRVALADGVRFEIEESLGFKRYDIKPLWEKPYSPEVRWLLQQWGTEFRRSQDPNYWVEKAVKEIHWAWDKVDLVVITDVRFENEADMIRDLGGLVVEVCAADDVRLARLGGVAPQSHASEVIDFTRDASIGNTDIPTASSAVIEYLGLEVQCVPCHRMEPHPWHDSSKPFPLWQGGHYSNPAPHDSANA